MKTSFPALLLLLLLTASGGCGKKSTPNPAGPPEDPDWPADKVRVVVSSGIGRPWEILWGPDNFIWMTERGGRICRVNPKTGQVFPLLTLPDIVANGEGGLLGMALHPDFSNSPFVYLSYNYGSPYREKVVRYEYGNNTLSSPLTLLDNIPAAGIHNGSRLGFGPDGMLYVTTGDAANGSAAQNTASLSGKVLRLRPDGSIPADNPVPNSPLWSLGHRNPQGLVFVGTTLYTSEHGANTEDEVNIIEKNRNYGWPDVQGPCNGGELDFCNANNVKPPIWSTGNSTYAVCGMDFYNHDRIPAWKNSLLLVSLKNATLYQLKLSSNRQSVASTTNWFANRYGRLRDICVSPNGRVYICTDADPGRIIEISDPG
ncbi:PQQ-dependent sugar dehydrogenase [Chitinophaga rhizosphaerae]|uniref:PQQ-dependent sugar dehydrogenase n=1 Tax=Chitinophaga rhizosphaerae TaxID=1864947 RepID=UPI000F8053D5|nr:PQQ-dependent sugar dehydrogenase [Chitinophaga rhizosphaerae]